MHVIATAGHVDHGKSSLVRALTGMDPDRLEEEKRRGLTIDLGFAWLKLPSGLQVGIVDVPGHERFIKNMLAGVGATDVAMFVVAANEGWQPQSQEHLDILDLLGFGSCLIVITKADLVNERELERLMADVSARISRTTLATSVLLPVSAKTGNGLDELVKHLDALIKSAPPPSDLGRPRLWIDRAFSIKGSGTVVTGTLVEGFLERDQEVEIVNKGVRARVRSIQSHRSEVEKIGPGNRVALNLVSVSPSAIERGDVLSLPQRWLTTQGFVAKLRFLDLGFDPNERGSFKVHVGSAEADCTLRFLGPKPDRGGEGFGLFRVLGPGLVLRFGDRMILRDSGRRRTLAGGPIIEPFSRYLGPASAKDALDKVLARMNAQGVEGYIEVLLNERPALPIPEARSISGLSFGSLPGIRSKNFLFSPDTFAALRADITARVREYQSDHLFEPGLPRTNLSVGSNPDLTDEIVDLMIQHGELVSEETFIRTPDHQPQTEAPEGMALLQELDAAGFSPPPILELNQRFDPSLVRSLVRSGRLIQIDRDIVISSRMMILLEEKVRHLASGEAGFTVASFRDHLGTTRKYAVPLLEYLDSKRFTLRQGDVRVLGPGSVS